MSFVVVRKIDPDSDSEDFNLVQLPAEELARLIEERAEEQVRQLRGAAEAEGRARGEAAARTLAESAPQRQAEDIATALQAFAAAAEQLTAPLARKERDLAALVVELGFSLARHLLGQEVSLNSQSIRGIVDALLAEAVEERSAGQGIIVRLNPTDHAVIAPHVEIDRVHMLADAQVARGGSLIELLAADGDPVNKVEWDATIETRLRELRLALLGQDVTTALSSGRSGDLLLAAS